jgi:hypothetical protein
MPITIPLSGQFRLLEPASGDAMLLPNPIYGYRTVIDLPFERQALDNGNVYIRDEGPAYDKRSCVIDLELTAYETMFLKDILYHAVRDRAKILDMYLPAGGFFPFGPDKGDSGTFNIVAEINQTEAIGWEPYKYFKCKLKLTNVGLCPTYSLPTEIPDGDFIIANTDEICFPQSLSKPNIDYQLDVQFTENNTPKFFDRGIEARSSSTEFDLVTNESKAAAILHDLTNVVRTAQFSVAPPDTSYMFGSDNGAMGPYIVILDQESIEVQHQNYNQFSFPLKLRKV